MATISAYIALRDGMTGPLKAIIHANNTLINALLSTQNASRHMIDTASLRTARTELAGMEEEITRSNQRQQQLNNSMRAGGSASNGLVNNVKRLAATYLSFQAAKGVIGLSDQMAGAQARLNLMVDDGGSVKALEQKIFESAQRSRSSYMSTMQSVSKFGLLAGKAFSSNDEIIRFAELMNKNFVIAGASASEQANAMYQLNQAMGSGRLQGDEYRSIIENAPLLAKAIEDYMQNVQGVKMSMKEMSAEGMLTAEVIKTALFKSADEVEARFAAMPKTFGQIWTSFKNTAVMAFKPVLEDLNNMANGERFQQGVAAMVNGVTIAAQAAAKAFGIIASGAAVVHDNWNGIGPVIWGAAAAASAFAIATKLSAVWTAIHAAGTAAHSLALVLYSAALFVAALMTVNVELAQKALNAALKASPIMWIVMLIGVLVYALVQWIQSVGGVKVAWIMAVNLIMTYADKLKIGMYSAVYGIMDKWDALCAGTWVMETAVLNALGDLKANGLMILQNFTNGAIDIIDDLINFANNIPGISIDTIDHVTYATEAGIKNEAEKQIRNARLAAVQTSFNQQMADRQGKLDAMRETAAGSQAQREAEISQAQKNALGKKRKENDEFAWEDTLTQIADNTGETAKKAGVSSEDLKYMRDIAERDVINRFTTAEIKVEMYNDNKISSDMDLDGMVAALGSKLEQRMAIAAEGAHR